MTATRNGTPQRKQLSDQLDRLDGIIDCLADGLSDAVRDAVKEGTATAIQQILLEVVNNPQTRELLRQTLSAEPAKPSEATTAPMPDAAAPPTRKASFLARCKRSVVKAARMIVSLPGKVFARVKNLLRKVKGLTRQLNIAWQLKKAAVLGLGIGAAVAAVSLWSHPLASILSGIGAAATAFAVQLGLWCRATARQLMA
jgi:glycogen synthase